MNDLRVSLVQMEVTNDKERNVDRAVELIRESSEQNPELVVLPENFSFMGTQEELFEQAEGYDGPTLGRLQNVADELDTHIVAGTMKLDLPGEDRLVNTSCVIDSAGELTDTYEKIHTFNADVGGSNFEGSRVERGGNEIVTTTIDGVTIGLTVCFDVRYPELYRILSLRGADVVLVPSLFMLHTGKDHWEPLLRTRAIENQVYVVAPAVIGTFPPDDDWSYGRSLVVDPWGNVVARMSDEEGIQTVDLDFSVTDDVRESLPTLPQRRPEVYDWPDERSHPTAGAPED